jgi:hypothetical protein
MEETVQYFEKRFFINRSKILIALPKWYSTHRNNEILSKSLVPTYVLLEHVLFVRDRDFFNAL